MSLISLSNFQNNTIKSSWPNRSGWHFKESKLYLHSKAGFAEKWWAMQENVQCSKKETFRPKTKNLFSYLCYGSHRGTLLPQKFRLVSKKFWGNSGHVLGQKVFLGGLIIMVSKICWNIYVVTAYHETPTFFWALYNKFWFSFHPIHTVRYI